MPALNLAPPSCSPPSLKGQVRELLGVAAWWCGFPSLLFAWLLFVGTPVRSFAEPPQVFEILPAQQLAFTQFEQLIAAGEAEAAVDLAVQMIDDAGDYLMPVQREGQTVTQRYLPLHVVVHDRLLRSGSDDDGVLNAFRQRYDRLAAEQLATAQENASMEELQQGLRRYFASSVGDEILLAIADLGLRNGWVTTAIEALHRSDPRWLPHAVGSSDLAVVSATDWPTLLASLDVQQQEAILSVAQQAIGRPGLPLGCYRDSDLDGAEVGTRLVYAYLLRGERDTAIKLSYLAKHFFGARTITVAGRRGTVAETLDRLLAESVSWKIGPGKASDRWSMLGGGASRMATAAPLALHHESPAWAAAWSHLPTLPEPLLPRWLRRASGGRAVQVSPVIAAGIVFSHTGSGVVAHHLEDGQAWPPGNVGGRVFQASEVDQPLWSPVRPVDAAFRFSLAQDGRWLAGRFGSMTDHDPRFKQAVAPSQLVVLDLQREAALQSGYPIVAPEGHHFAGPPLPLQGRLFAPRMQTDEATQITRIVCYDVATGRQLWVSAPVVVERRARELASAADIVIAAEEGRLFCHHGGVTASLDAGSGKLLWAVRHALAELADLAYPQQRDSIAKSHAALGVQAGELFVAGVNVDRVFSLDAADGRLRWATEAGVADDVEQVLGVAGAHVIMGGRRLYWIHRASGRIAATFPDGATNQPGAGSQWPVGSGRGVLTDAAVYWPTAAQIFVFDNRLVKLGEQAQQLRTIGRLPLTPFGLQGGCLAAAAGFLVLSESDQLTGFTDVTQR